MEQEIIIVGAGPSGLLLALNLARAGIKSRVLEAATELDTQPRACLYGPAAVRELRRAGVLDAMAPLGSLVPAGVSWRAPGDAALLAQLPKPSTPPPKDQDGVVSLSLHLVVGLLRDLVQAEPHATVEFGRRVRAVGQDEHTAWVVVSETSTPDSAPGVRMEGSYVVGCDGSSSTVRSALFGHDFPGSTWDPWLVALNVRFRDPDVVTHTAGLSDVSFVVHPTDWCLLARIGGPAPLWRVTYGDDAALAAADVVAPARIRERLAAVLPTALAALLSDDYDDDDEEEKQKQKQVEIVHASPYRAHQRCAPRFRVGRVLLAADAAHLCNPFGGMGLTSGLVDVGGLSDCFVGMHRGVAGDDILDRYDSVRRGIYHDIVDTITTANFRRIMQDAQTAVQTDPILVACREAETNAEMAGKVAAMMRAPALLQHDFTQYYSTQEQNA